MNLHRNTYVEINLNNIKYNVNSIINNHKCYKYYIGVVKANCYGHKDIKTVKAIIKGGCNYLAVATLDEALYIRKHIKNIPILCLGVIPYEYVKICKKKNITITINSLDYMKELSKENIKKLKAHIKINTGMNRLGISNVEEVLRVMELAKNNNIILEGIYTHIYEASNIELYNKQKEAFENILKNIKADEIFDIIHMSASEAMTLYEKPKFVNGCRLGIIMYGFTARKDLNLKSTFKLYSEVIQINTIKKDETVGYNGIYKSKNDEEKIAVVSIGYDDGIIRKNTGRNVYINDKEYPIVGNVCMDMLFVKVDDDVNVHDKVEVLKDVKHIEEVAKYLETIPYEIICSVGDRVVRKYC